MKEYWVVFVGKSVLFRKEEDNDCHLIFEDQLPQDIKRTTDIFRFHTSDGKTINVLQADEAPESSGYLRTSSFWQARVGNCFIGTGIRAIAVSVAQPLCPIRKYQKNARRAVKNIGHCSTWPSSASFTEERKCF